MKQKIPLVTIIMPVHNAGKFLVPAIESILAQTYARFELIIVDDGSTDQSWKTIRAYKKRYPKTIRVYRTEKQLNSAGNGATDVGLSHAKGEYIARMDGDDVASAASTSLKLQPNLVPGERVAGGSDLASDNIRQVEFRVADTSRCVVHADEVEEDILDSLDEGPCFGVIPRSEAHEEFIDVQDVETFAHIVFREGVNPAVEKAIDV